ncbi:Ig heavy chain V region AC38 15.3 [Liparis tanakae]|uniref:Ig heavy chain V region AC38 15.3 n=1 Tax=Liparis tanakae TaxID=230148 RepID=A0A4Z2FER8_9TELE|nr:Ig heavy chain V region AC38 15.3 [Liparis tanakae]
MIGLLFCCLAGACLGLDVRQSPSDVIAEPGVTVQMFCSHDGTNSRLMFWYRQSPGDAALELIGHLYFNFVTMEELYKEHFNMSGDLRVDTSKNVSLVVKASPEHSAVYYCAAGNNRLFSSEMLSPVVPPRLRIYHLCQLFFTAGLAVGVQVRQSPSELIGEAGGEARLVCTHAASDSRAMLWYRQPRHGGALTLIGHQYGQFDNVEEPFRKHFQSRKLRVSSRFFSFDMTPSRFIVSKTKMYLVFLRIAFGSVLVSGSRLSEKVRQTPADMFNKPKENATISCSHSIEYYDKILWYKQTGDTQLQFLGYMFKTYSNPEGGLDQVKSLSRHMPE